MYTMYRNSSFWGFFILLGGVALLIQNIFHIPLGGLFWGVAFLVAGAGFLYQFRKDNQMWWPLIPGFSFLGFGLSSLAGVIFPRLDFLQDVLALGGISVAFIMVYLRERRNWWAVIPAGVLLTIAVISILESTNLQVVFEPLFFLGVGITFLILYSLPDQKLNWAIIPALVLIFTSSLIGFFANPSNSLIWSLVLIFAGAILILRSFRKA